MGNLGWRTITGTIAIAIGNGLKSLPGDLGPVLWIADIMIFAGTLLAGIGIRAAIAKK